MRTVALLSILVVSSLVSISCSDTDTRKTTQKNNARLIAQANISNANEKKIQTIDEVLSSDVGFKDLAQAVQSSGFSKIFNEKGSYTVFAPTNGAFRRLPEGTLENLLKPKNKEQLSAVMNCHIISGILAEEDMIKAIKKGRGSIKLKTLGGSELIASLKKGKIYLIDKNGNAGRLMKTDIEATNGIVHTLESVMLPKK